MEAEERPNKKRRLTAEADGASGSIPDDFNIARTNLDEAGKDLNQTDSDLQNVHPGKDDHEETENRPVTSEVNGDHLPNPSSTAPLADSLPQDPDQPPLSKSQQKKLRKKAEWESKREERKVFRKEKMIAKRERRREERKLHRQAQEDQQTGTPPPPKVKGPKPKKAVTLPVTILIDCGFDDLMRDNERISLAAQVTRSYSDNRKALFRAHLAVCSFNGLLRERFENVLSHYKGWKGVRFLECGFVEAAEQAKGWMEDGDVGGAFGSLAPDDERPEEDKEEAMKRMKDEAEIVYLSSESENTLDRLKPFSAYIIGGLVDKNREKGICYKRAVEAGIKTAKLPIGDFMEMQSRKVLATNHVNEICVKWLECGDWGEAFMKVIPKRKGGKLKGTAEDGQEVGDEDDDGEADVVDDVAEEGLVEERRTVEVEREENVEEDVEPMPETGSANGQR
jgi:tRNA (guanine9-N1)-methyltransferase